MKPCNLPPPQTFRCSKMAIFADTILHGQALLSIAEGQNASDEALLLPVFDPVMGSPFPCQPAVADLAHPRQWFIDTTTDLHDLTSSATIPSSRALLLRSSLHSEDDATEHFTLLGDQINDGKAAWTAPLASFGQFSFINQYWEWAEDVLGRSSEKLLEARIYGAVYASLFTYDRDANLIKSFCEHWCPSTNTLHTPAGELSISLWDLCYIGGLPVYEKFYDEVIPPARDLIGVDENNMYLLPPSCRHLFAAYHRLFRGSETHHITAHDWIHFWCRLRSKYLNLSSNDQSEGASRPTGHTSTPPERTKDEEGAFNELGIKARLREEVYLAAFLSCWLSVFVLPNGKENQIRPTVFKVASMMARGSTFSLAVPVLASIYHGLKQISSSPAPSQCHAILPMHYIYGWLGNYFDTYLPSSHAQPGVRMVRLAGEKNAKHFTALAARKLLISVDPSLLSSLAMSDKDERLMVDDGKQSHFWTAYTISLRSSYLTFRCDMQYIVESYSPHRSSRQFNFYQDVPGKLVEEACPLNLPDVVRLWQSCTKLGTKAKLKIPVSSHKGLTTKRYQEWWTKHASNFVKGNIEPAEKQEKTKTPVRIRLTKGKGAVTPIVNAHEVEGTSAIASKAKASKAKPNKAKPAVLPTVNNEEVDGTNATLCKAKASKARPSRAKPKVQPIASAHEVDGANATTSKAKASKARPSKAKPTIPPTTSTHEVDGANATISKAKASKAKPNQGKDLPKDASKEMEKSTLKTKPLLKISAPKIPSIIVKNPTTENGNKKRGLVICDGDINSSQDVPDSSTPLEDLEAHLGVNNLNLGDELHSQSSEGSIDGPDSFGLLSGKGRSVEYASRQISHEKAPVDMPKAPIIEPRQFQVKPSGPALSDVSVFQGINVITKSRREYVSKLWSHLSHKIGKTYLAHVDDIEDEAEKVLEEMRNMEALDISPLQRNLKSFFDNIRAYKNRSASIKSCASQLADISQTLSHAKIRENEIIKESELCQQEFEALEVDKAKLKRALEGIDTKLKAKEAAVVANEGELSEVQLEISNLEDKVSAIKNAAVQTDENIAKSEEMRRLLEANQNELANLKLFP
ncbi:hypothetical protein RHGRI_011915 [Rhododendron griersonianum]|uniref:Aminotransferase-like plant mobile domain-containing protein n=1 Tax=Rhododendron griersonianum TaxID=479676 RepID=A0AAV6KPV1_9ERIC|nr:hypothetical protein RHGRI_011915 [Rhododendron griersonianum]